MRYRLLAIAGASAAVLLGAAACGGSSGGGGDNSTPPPSKSASTSASDTSSSASSTSGSSSSSSSSASSSSASTPGNITYTAQGTKLSLGQKAIVPYSDSDAQGAIGITVTSVTKGDPNDLAELSGDDTSGQTPFYVKFTVTNESGTDLHDLLPPDLAATSSDASTVQSLLIIGTFDKCDNAVTPDDFTTQGASFDDCALLTTGGASLTLIAYNSTDGDDANIPNTDYSDHPLTWPAS
jgi:hypothetical protein